jgi:hypothetical protein
VKRASDILARLLDESADEQSRSASGVFRSWAQIVGEPLADHSRVYELQHGQLCVEVDHPGWLQMLLLRKTQILQGVARAYPQLSIRGLRARVNPRYAEGSSAASNRPAAAAPAAPPAGTSAAAAAPEVEQAVSAAGPDELKERLRRLFAASLRRGAGRSGRGPDRG